MPTADCRSSAIPSARSSPRRWKTARLTRFNTSSAPASSTTPRISPPTTFFSASSAVKSWVTVSLIQRQRGPDRRQDLVSLSRALARLRRPVQRPICPLSRRPSPGGSMPCNQIRVTWLKEPPGYRPSSCAHRPTTRLPRGPARPIGVRPEAPGPCSRVPVRVPGVQIVAQPRNGAVVSRDTRPLRPDGRA